MKTHDIEKIKNYATIFAKNHRNNLEDFISEKISEENFIKLLYSEISIEHGYNHIIKVLKNGTDLLGRELSLKERLAIILHDIGNTFERDSHEVIAYHSVLSLLDGLFLDEEINEIANSALRHRASFKGNFETSLDELVSSADRGEPNSMNHTIWRSYEFGKNKFGLNHEESMNHALEHIKDKYGKNGYAQFPNLYLNYHKENLENFRFEADNLTIEKIEKVLLSYI